MDQWIDQAQLEMWLMWLLYGGIFLWMAWSIFKIFWDRWKEEEAEINTGMLNGLAKASGWVSFEEAIDLMERGWRDFGRALEAARILGDVATVHPQYGSAPQEVIDRAVRALINGLEYSDPTLRATAALSLGKIADPAAIPALTRIMQKSEVSQHEIEQLKAASFERDFHQARAKREGVSISELRVPNPEEEHAKAREAARWALQEIRRKHG